MTTKTDKSIVLVKICLGIFIATICIAFIIALAILVWGYFEPSYLTKFTWKPDLVSMRKYSIKSYIEMGLVFLAYLILYLILFYELMKISSKLDLAKPFNQVIANSMLKVSYCLISLFFLDLFKSYFASIIMTDIQIANGLKIHEIYEVNPERFYPLMAGLVTYTFSLIYQKGLEIQSENDLTV
jgi:hypothetical protein